MKVLFLITARGGSKGVPGKNLKEICGISLVGYKAISAKKSKYCKRLIISTDSHDIQNDAEKYGVEIPFMRPTELATDTAKSAQVVSHAMNWIEEQGEDKYDAVMLLEPASPFAQAADYDAAIDLLIEKNANAVVGVRSLKVGSLVMGPMDDTGRLTTILEKLHASREMTGRRQLMPKEVTMNGALYVFRWEYFMKHQWIYHDISGVYGYLMDEYHSTEIDEPIDLEWARFIVEKGYIDQGEWKHGND